MACRSPLRGIRCASMFRNRGGSQQAMHKSSIASVKPTNPTRQVSRLAEFLSLRSAVIHNDAPNFMQFRQTDALHTCRTQSASILPRHQEKAGRERPHELILRISGHCLNPLRGRRSTNSKNERTGGCPSEMRKGRLTGPQWDNPFNASNILS